MADLQVSIALLLENQDEIRRALEAEGGKAGEAFRNRLTPAARKAFDEITSAAEKAAKDVGLKFNKVDFSFRTPEGKFVSQEQLQGLAKANQAFKDAVEGANRLKSAISSASTESASSLNILEGAVTGVAVSLTSALTDSVTAGLGGLKGLVGGFMELDGELRMAAAAAGETGGYERLGQIVEKVGIDAAGTSKQVAELATSLVRAGFSVSEVEKALPGVVRGAEATGTGFEQMGNIVGNTLRGFGLEAEQVGRVTDVLVNAANSSNASIEGLGYTFEYTAPIAKALGVSLEDVAAAAGLMANAGIQGSVAGTGLRTGLQKLQEAAGGASPAVLGLSRGQERLAQTMKMIGATVTDTAGNLLPLEQVFLNLKEGLSKLSQADQVQLTNILFGDEAGSKFLSITNQSSDAISKMFSDMQNSAGATDVARNAMSGFGLEMRQLQGTLEAIGTSVGGVIAAGLRPFVGIANSIAGAVSGLPGPIKTTGAALIAMAGAAAAASVGIGALNVVVGSVGGWVAMRASIASVAAVITGPLGAGVLIFAGLGAAAGVLTGHFRETDRTTKTLLQTAVGLGAFVAVLKGITVAQVAWNNASKVGVTLQTLLTALTPGGLAKVAVAAGVAAGAYYAMGQAISVTGEETTAMADKSKAVKNEIAQLGKEIEQGKKLNIDTSDLQKLKDTKEAELQQLENPLEIKLNIQKAEAQIKSLQEQKDKLGKDAPAAAGFDAQIRAAEKYRDVLKAAEEGVGSKGFAELDAASKKFVQDQQAIKDKIQGLMAQKIDLPIEAKIERDRIDKEISGLQNLAGKNELKFKAGLDLTQLEVQLEVARAKLEKAQKPIGKGAFESNDSFAKREAEQKQKVEGYMKSIADLQTKIAAAQGQAVGASEQQANAAAKQVQSEKDKADAIKASLDAQKSKLENEQRGIDLGGRLLGIDKSRLETIRQMADAYMNMASAQAGLTQSQFDVKSARNNRDVNVANEEVQAIREAGQEALQYMRDRGASQDQIAAKEREIADTIKAKEQEIKDLKERGKQIEQEALVAAIEGAAKRFEMERKVLELKQMSAKLEQEAAIRTAERGVLEDRKGLLDLKTKRLDPNLTDAQKSAIDEQIGLQQQSIELSNAQVKAEKERLGQLEQIFAMEKDTLAMKQGTEANQFRAKAAEQGWEGNLKPQLDQLDQSKGKVGENKMAWEDVTKQADKVLKVINDHNKAIKEGTKSVGDLAKAYQGVKPRGGSGDGGADPKRTIANGQKANKRIISDRERMFADMVQQEEPYRKRPFTYAYTDNFLYMAGQKSESNKPGSSWYDDSELAAIKKLKGETKKTADEFFATSDSATYLERSLKAVGKQVTVGEKMKYYAKAISEIVNGNIDGFQLLKDIRPLDINFNPVLSKPSDWLPEAEKMANKQQLDWPNPFAGDEKIIDYIASQLADAEAKAAGLKGAIEGARDSIGRPIENTPFNLQEIAKNFRKDSLDAMSPESARQAMEGKDFSLKPKLDTTGAEKDLGAFKQQEARDPLKLPVAPAGQPDAKSADGMAGKGDFTLKPTIDTTAAEQALQSLKNQQEQDPIKFSVDPSSLQSMRGPVQDFINQLKTTEPTSIDFNATGLDKIRNDLSLTTGAVDAFKAGATGIDESLSSSFNNASSALLPLADQIRGIGTNFQSLGTGGDPFATVGTSLANATTSTDAINTSLQTATQIAQGFADALSNGQGAQALQAAYDALKPPDVSQAVSEQSNLAEGTQGTVSTTQDLANSWIGVAGSINTAAQALANYKSQEGGSKARFAGGDVFGGRQYTVNELGQEAFLSASGRLSLIRTPQYGHWTAPSRGLVIPASMTSRLEAAGAFSRGGGPGPRVSAALVRPSPGAGGEVAALRRLQRSIDRLEKTMGSYRPPDVSVTMPGNAGLLHTLQSFR